MFLHNLEKKLKKRKLNFFLVELLEILRVNDSIDLAQNIINEYDTNHDGKLNIDGNKLKFFFYFNNT